MREIRNNIVHNKPRNINTLLLRKTSNNTIVTSELEIYKYDNAKRAIEIFVDVVRQMDELTNDKNCTWVNDTLNKYNVIL